MKTLPADPNLNMKYGKRKFKKKRQLRYLTKESKKLKEIVTLSAYQTNTFNIKS